jgi:hypothetical protein
MRIEEFEFRRNENHEYSRDPEIVQWATDQNGKEYCFTLLWFKRGIEDWYIEFVGDRPLTVENRETLWKMMEYGQTVLDVEIKLWS